MFWWVPPFGLAASVAVVAEGDRTSASFWAAGPSASACSSHSCGSSTRGRSWMPSILAYSCRNTSVMAGSRPTSGMSNRASACRARMWRRATRSKAGRKPCTCSGLPLACSGASQTRRPSRAANSMKSASCSVSKYRVKLSCTRMTLCARSSAESAASAAGVAVSTCHRCSTGWSAMRLMSGLSTMPTCFSIMRCTQSLPMMPL